MLKRLLENVACVDFSGPNIFEKMGWKLRAKLTWLFRVPDFSKTHG